MGGCFINEELSDSGRTGGSRPFSASYNRMKCSVQGKINQGKQIKNTLRLIGDRDLRVQEAIPCNCERVLNISLELATTPPKNTKNITLILMLIC